MATNMSAEVFRSDGIRLSVTAMAREFGSTRETVLRRLSAFGVRPDGDRPGHQVYRLRDAVRAILLVGADEAGNPDPDKMTPKDQLDFYKSRREKLKLAEESGQLLPVEEARGELAHVVKSTVQLLDTLPDILDRDCHIGHEAIVRVEAALDGLRAELYGALNSDDGPDRTTRLAAPSLSAERMSRAGELEHRSPRRFRADTAPIVTVRCLLPTIPASLAAFGSCWMSPAGSA